MISIYQLKPRFQQALQPVCDFLYRQGFTANQVTIAAILLSAGLGFLFLCYPHAAIVLLLIPIGLLVRMGLNAIDGMMARQYGMESKLGQVLNELGDVLSDLFIILPLAIISTMNSGIIILFAMLTILNEFAGILGQAMGGTRRYDGPMGKSDRALIIGLFCLVGYYWQSVFLYGNIIFGIASVLLIISTFIRLKNAVRLT